MCERNTGNGHGCKGGKMYLEGSIQMLAASHQTSTPKRCLLYVIGCYWGVIAC